MKKLLIVLSLLSASFALAEPTQGEIPLNDRHLHVSTPSADLLRLPDSPKKVVVSLEVPLEFTYCSEMGTTIVFGKDPSCPPETHMVYHCTQYCAVHLHNRCVRWEQRCGYYPVTSMGSCNHEIHACVKYDVRTENQSRKVKLIFRKAAPLAENETETFHLSGKQEKRDSNQVDFALSAVRSRAHYKMHGSDFFGHRISVKQVGVKSADVADENAAVELQEAE